MDKIQHGLVSPAIMFLSAFEHQALFIQIEDKIDRVFNEFC
ncbi:hypothetical protein [sulfur-oxidizing endosymbiont of Gigantopelta aegis]|nr:hypothetical protein [sulfur-oxidizing endosymbiont of Gigantopelta aegis]